MILERSEHSMDLWDYVQEVGWMTVTTARLIFEQSEKIVLDFNTGDAKLIDFGCGTLLHADRYKGFSGTLLFYNPESYTEVSWSREAKHLIAWMLSCDPDSRPRYSWSSLDEYKIIVCYV
ncbi:unnamed protein product [Clavelina lepadiformis]|uniref:non-specific serine/threonine protein kinase n=1 Tax=Clavelina lepadiformis TaxID=159417 RepID=A0ABP0FV04_CLALP